MGKRGKVVLARINNKKQRNDCLRKRIKGLLKKVEEITTLCDTEAAVVIYNSDDNQPIVWLSTTTSEAIFKFLDTPEAGRITKSHTVASFMEEQRRKEKAKAQQLIDEERNIQALIKSIHEGKTKIQDLDSETKKKISDFTDLKMEEIRKNIQRIKMEQKVPQSHQVLSPAVQMPLVSQATNGLNINGLGAGRNHQSPTAAHGQLMDVGGITQLAHAPGYELNEAEVIHGQSNVDGIMQQEAFSQAKQMTSVSQVASSLRALNINDLDSGEIFTFPTAADHGQDQNLREGSLPDITNHSLINASTWENIGEMELDIPPPSVPLDSSHKHLSSNTSDIGGSRNFTRDGTYRDVIQHGPPCLLHEPSQQIGQPPKQYDAGGLNMSESDEYSQSTIGISVPDVTSPLDPIYFFDDDSQWDIDEFLAD